MPNSFKDGWKALNWKVIESAVFKRQTLIYEASKAGDLKLVRKHQNLLIDSYNAKLLAVRRVTQDNKGKKTAGVDGKTVVLPAERFELAATLKCPTGVKPLRRAWISKPGTDEKRPLGIPSIVDRALQALLKITIEPEWEAKFEPNSYGFRPGRGSHDAMRAVSNCITTKAKYVLDADLSKCFDKIDHEKLLAKLGYYGAYKTQIKCWLKAGVLNEYHFSETTAGTPQEGVISPLLANIALHGMEEMLRDYVATVPLKYPNERCMGIRDRRASLAFIRYADDFVVLHASKEVVLHCKMLIAEFLKDMGLEFSLLKTRMTHTLALNNDDTLTQGFDGKVGFNFLGFTVKQFKTKHKSAYSTSGDKLGYKTLIYPSKEKIQTHSKKLHQVILHESLNSTQDKVIRRINPIISRWAKYFGTSTSTELHILGKLDHLLYLKLKRWGQKITKGGKKGFVVRQLWKSSKNRNWVFKGNNQTLVRYTDYSSPLNSYVKVQNAASPFDGRLMYWASRMGKSPSTSLNKATLLKKQKCRCAFCKQIFQEIRITEVDHIIPISQGGKDGYDNLQLLHKHCHDKKTRLDNFKPKT